MGCKQSDLSSGEYEDMGARVNSLLASLPKLYCEIYSENARWLCTAYVTEDFEKVLFSCTNNTALYQKIVTQEELIKMVR